jgi:hypothetical protein
MADVLDLMAFRKWLEASSYHTVGLAGDSCECPIASWLSEMYRQPHVVCGGMYSPLDLADHEPVPLPAWAKRFVEMVDRAYGCRPVLRIGALSLLDRCLREVT